MCGAVEVEKKENRNSEEIWDFWSTFFIWTEPNRRKTMYVLNVSRATFPFQYVGVKFATARGEIASARFAR
jgi:hypothetical protein